MAGKWDRTGELDGNGNGQHLPVRILWASNANIEWCFRYLHLLYCLYLLISDAHTDTEPDADTKPNTKPESDTDTNAAARYCSNPSSATDTTASTANADRSTALLPAHQ